MCIQGGEEEDDDEGFGSQGEEHEEPDQIHAVDERNPLYAAVGLLAFCHIVGPHVSLGFLGQSLHIMEVAMRVKPKSSLMLSKLGDDMVLLDVEKGVYHGLNETAARYWELLCDSGDTGIALDAILQEYEVADDVLRADMEALVQAFLAEHGLEPVDA